MKKLFLIFLIHLLFGCFSTPNSNFFILEKSDLQEISAKKIIVAVYNINIPDFMDKPQIVLQKPNSPEIKISEFNRWGTDLSTMFKNVLISNLSQTMPNTKFVPLAYGTNYKYTIKIDIEKFNGWLNDSAYLNVNWQILNSNGKTIYSQNLQYITPSGKTYESYVKAQSKLLKDLSKDIALKLSEM